MTIIAQNDRLKSSTTSPDRRAASPGSRVNLSSFTSDSLSSNGVAPQVRNESMNRSGMTSRLAHAVISKPGQTVLMLLTGLIYSLQLPAGYWLIEAATVIVLLRLLLYLTTSESPAILGQRVRASLKLLIREETLVGLAFLAIASLISWPAPAADLALFLLASLFVQSGLLLANRVGQKSIPIKTSPGGIIEADSVLVVGSGKLARKIIDTLYDQTEPAVSINGILDYNRTGLWRYRDIPLLGHPDKLAGIVGGQQIDLLLIAVELDDLANVSDLFMAAEQLGLPIALVNDLVTPRLAIPTGETLAGQPVIYYHSAPKDQPSLKLKSLFDQTLALIGLIVISPVMLLTALLIKLESKGPVFFKQIRSGLNGRPFGIYKFRTMGVDAEERKAALSNQNEMSGPVFKIKKDPRITRLGKYLRKYSIDELPQLINVLRGEMSLVGPRPPLPNEVAGMKPWQRRKLSVKPGVTCIWQVSGRNAIDFEEWMRLDLDYIDNWSLWSDMKLIARTIPTVLRGSGS